MLQNRREPKGLAGPAPEDQGFEGTPGGFVVKPGDAHELRPGLGGGGVMDDRQSPQQHVTQRRTGKRNRAGERYAARGVQEKQIIGSRAEKAERGTIDEGRHFQTSF